MNVRKKKRTLKRRFIYFLTIYIDDQQDRMKEKEGDI